ncbi:MAG: hypothetical protein KDB37_04955 [Ilumatobacter sp.]|nr:hypothetical protein [Ilumatobacter sp.]
MTDKPVLRDLYDRVADELGPRLTELTASDEFAAAVEIAGAARDRAAVELARSSRRFLHAWNLPAGADITVLRQEIGALDRNVRALARQVEELQRQLAATQQRPGQRRKAS